MRAYHFVGSTLRDGRPIPQDGELLRVEPPIELCQWGLHASVDPFDALQYAPGNTLCLVEMGGQIIHGRDKLVATERTIIKRIDATSLLRQFAREQAALVMHLWDAPAVVVHYLLTGEEEYREEAASAAELAAISAAQLKGWSATSAAAAASAAARWAAAATSAAAATMAAASSARWAAAAAAAAAARAAAAAAARAARWAAARSDFNEKVKAAGMERFDLSAAGLTRESPRE